MKKNQENNSIRHPQPCTVHCEFLNGSNRFLLDSQNGWCELNETVKENLYLNEESKKAAGRVDLYVNF